MMIGLKILSTTWQYQKEGSEDEIILDECTEVVKIVSSRESPGKDGFPENSTIVFPTYCVRI